MIGYCTHFENDAIVHRGVNATILEAALSEKSEGNYVGMAKLIPWRYEVVTVLNTETLVGGNYSQNH